MTEQVAATEDTGEWTVLQEAYIQKLMATYQANLYLFKERFPKVFDKIMESDLPAPFTVGPKGELKIYSGKYEGDPRDFVDLGRLLLKMFEDINTRPRIVVGHEYVDDPAAVAPHQDNPDFYQHIEPRFRIELIERFREMTPEEGERLPLSDFGDHKLPIAIVFGSGYGWHLDRLVDDWELRHLVLVDTDIQRLNLSLYFVDYISLEQRFSRKGFYFTVAFDEDTDSLADQLRHLLYHFWPPYFIQGAGLFFNDYDSEKVRALWGKLKGDLWTLYRGWGFLDDEILGLKQAIENGVDRHPLFTRRPEMPEDAIAFVVGAGPSLDRLVPILKAMRDKAVIFSCGSAITALAREGIKPDFHVEVERTFLTCRFLEEPVTKAFIRDVPIIALSIMHPAVFELTDRPLMFLKELDLGTAVGDFFADLPRFRSGPTCTNGGLALALRMNFRRIYLAGVDFGFRDEKHHHARSSIYFDEDVDIATDLKKVVSDTHSAHEEAKGREVDANFGGKCLSTEIFMHSRDAMVLTLKEFPGSQVFNMNDGALIKGAEPLQPEDFDVQLTPEHKDAAIAAAHSAFTHDYDPDPLRNLAMLEEQLRAVREDVARILSAEVKTKMDVCDLLYDLHHYFFDERHQSTQIFPLVRGSMLHMGRFFFDCVSLFKNEARAVEYGRFGFELFQRFLAAGSDTLASLHEVGRARMQANAARNHTSGAGEQQ